MAAEVDYAPPGQWCRDTPPRYESAPNEPPTSSVLDPDGGYSWTVRPADLRDRTLVIEYSTEVTEYEQHGFEFTESRLSLSIGTARRPVAPCELVDAQ
ncbi:hypothetical protein [Actinophytocola gossypii]|uniref:hypothetical protein n=1 Tax=Actinophytocola gossypii TaxID=2812003 RepID=UPI0021A8405E|nr:hypothetical protein [Actinophytocola gossypii]